jgi:hypothetical protein
MLVLVEDAAEAVASADVKGRAGVRMRDGRRQCLQRPVVGDALVGPVAVVELLELAQRVEQVPLVPDQGPVVEAGGKVGPLFWRVPRVSTVVLMPCDHHWLGMGEDEYSGVWIGGGDGVGHGDVNCQAAVLVTPQADLVSDLGC